MTGGMGNTVSQNHQRHYFEYTVVRFLFLRANGTYRLSSICSFDVKGDNAKVRIGENCIFLHRTMCQKNAGQRTFRWELESRLCNTQNLPLAYLISALECTCIIIPNIVWILLLYTIFGSLPLKNKFLIFGF